MKELRNCTNCVHCWRDDSVDDRECLVMEDMTEDEIEKYYSEMESGCPYFMDEYEANNQFLEAVVKCNYFGL